MRLSEKAYQLIGHKIITLEMPPRAHIDEQALMQDLGLGRTPIREALQRLAADGLVEIAPRRGMFVADISITDLQKIFELRMVLEGFCARLAAQRATDGQLREMDRLIAQLADVPEGDNAAFMDIDERFHALLYAAADNEFLGATSHRLHALSLRLWYLVLSRLGNVRAAMDEHAGIACALRARDSARAEALVQRHIREFQQEIKSVI